MNNLNLNNLNRLSKKKKSQAAVEMVVVMAIILIFLVYIIELDQDILWTIEADYTEKKISFTMDSLIQEANLLYQQGSGARDKIRLSIPAHVSDIQINGRIINVTMNLSGEISQLPPKKLSYNLSGSVPSEEGQYWFKLVAGTGYVNLTRWNGTWND